MGVEKRHVARGGKNIIFRGGGGINIVSDRNIDPCKLLYLQDLIKIRLNTESSFSLAVIDVVFEAGFPSGRSFTVKMCVRTVPYRSLLLSLCTLLNSC
jgi:hypothetical protein